MKFYCVSSFIKDAATANSTITNHAGAGGTANANSSSLRNRRNVDTMCAAAGCVLICKMSGSKFKSGKTNTKGSETQWLEILKEEVW